MEVMMFHWCFDHGSWHTTKLDEQCWCTAAWVTIEGDTQEEADANRNRMYGSARFLHELPPLLQVKVVEQHKKNQQLKIVRKLLPNEIWDVL